MPSFSFTSVHPSTHGKVLEYIKKFGLTVQQTKGLAELLMTILEVESKACCEMCDRIEPKDAYEYLCDNPPERY